ncbi:hypothetical protein [Actinomadura chibensis]|uniref:hypothetical protein n=1 Tax=Actinomadura chibensis TaxID=392828 RepID=UPI000836D288|nr:hypothetical protein [Actinomadura chibensis]
MTWEPWLTNAVKKNEDGLVLASTREYPTILADTIGFRPDVVKGDRAAVQGFVQAMADAAKRPVKEIAGLLEYATLCDLAANKRYFGTASAPGDLYKVFAEAGALSVASALALWALVTYTGLVDPFFLSSPSAVAAAFADMVTEQGFLGDIAASFLRIAAGFALACGAAVRSASRSGRRRGSRPCWSRSSAPSATCPRPRSSRCSSSGSGSARPRRSP